MKNILIKGAPATGKTLIARALAYYIGHEGLDIKDVYTKDIQADRDEIETYIQSSYVEYIQIHPSMAYEDIVYGIEITAGGALSMAYAEKRIKQLCDRAKGRTEDYFIILDDIGRVNAGSLLGNLLYAMEYRNQPVGLCDGTTMAIPDNVYLIVTECRTVYGNPLEYAIQRRFGYQKELKPDGEVLSRYYDSCLSEGARTIIQNVFETVCGFVNRYVLQDSTVKREDYIPGHGMFIVDRGGSQAEILMRVKRKFEYQLYPYLVDMAAAGILTANETELKNLQERIFIQINAGQKAAVVHSSVQKRFFASGEAILPFSLKDSRNYYQNTILPGGCKEHRAIIENIVDAIFTNGVFPVEKAMSDILLNTRAVRFEHRTSPGVYAAFLVDAAQNQHFGYLTTVSKKTRSYYSSNPCRTGRWAGRNDAPAYRVADPNGTAADYISLNAFRNVGFDTTTQVIHAEENTASIYCALYHLVRTYLLAYEKHLTLLVENAPSYQEIYQLVCLERRYWELKNKEAQSVRGGEAKLNRLGSAALNIRTLWTMAGTMVDVDENRFDDLASGRLKLSVAAYEGLYRLSGAVKSIEIKGVDTMVDVKDYQKVMEGIGVRQMIFQGPPGTSKTFESKKFVLQQLNPGAAALSKKGATQEQISNELAAYKLNASDYENPTASGKLTTGGWDLVQFHPSYGYEDFIRGIEVKPIQGTPTYSSVNRILGKIAEFAKLAEEAAAPGGDAPKFYLVIDEINRANLAAVFGELIYGLEYRDSRVSTPYEVEDRVTGARSKDIVLGKNLFLIGTMNTADKSIDSIDYAIRRRFLFIDSPAKREVVLDCYHNTMGVDDDDSIEALLFDAVGYLFEGGRFFNEEYQRNDVRIGHTYFLRNSKTGYLDAMAERLVFQVIPILREYVKDGILDPSEDLTSCRHSAAEIAAAAPEDRISLLGENVMVFAKHFGERMSGEVIDNHYIVKFIEELCAQLGY